MPRFKYVAKDQSAKTISGELVADNQAMIIDELRKRKLIIISIKETKQKGLTGMSFGKKKVKSIELVIFSRQLATMVDAGIPLMQSLDALQEQIQSSEFRRIIGSLRDDIEIGTSLSTAFSRHPEVFDNLYINMVKAGESSGMLNIVLERIAGYLEKANVLKNKVRSAMVYPVMVMTMAILITGVLMVKVVPTFKGIFEMLGGELPLPTQILITTSDLITGSLWQMIAIIIIVVVVLSRLIKTEKGRLKIDQLKLKVPVLGQLFRKVAVSRFSRTLATLIQSGVPILGSLDIVAKTSGNKVIETAVNNVKANIREGESIAAPLARSGVFPPMVTRMIAVGEQTGELQKMLSKISDFYDEQVDSAIAGLTSLIEPVIIAFLGIVIGGIVVSLFLPILKITQMIGA